MEARKLCLRLTTENPLHRRAWEKIQRSGEKIQSYLLEAVLAYEPGEKPGGSRGMGGLSEEEIERIGSRVAEYLSRELGTLPVQETLEEWEDEQPEETIPDDMSAFLDSL